jgi:hypothetical protein
MRGSTTRSDSLPTLVREPKWNYSLMLRVVPLSRDPTHRQTFQSADNANSLVAHTRDERCQERSNTQWLPFTRVYLVLGRFPPSLCGPQRRDTEREFFRA